MKPKTLFPLAGLPEFDEISAVETEADGLACNYISPSQIHARHACYHELLAVMDFIFHVDLSTAYVVLRRDFVTSQDPQGSQSSPVGAGFYCMTPQTTICNPQNSLQDCFDGGTKNDHVVTNSKAEQTRPRLLMRRREHTAPRKPQRTGAS
jgi:hypothetical protein